MNLSNERIVIIAIQFFSLRLIDSFDNRDILNLNISDVMNYSQWKVLRSDEEEHRSYIACWVVLKPWDVKQDKNR